MIPKGKLPFFTGDLQKANLFFRLFGVTTLDVVRAARFVSEVKHTDPENEIIPVVGGHSGVTIVPLLSQSGHDFKSNPSC